MKRAACRVGAATVVVLVLGGCSEGGGPSCVGKEQPVPRSAGRQLPVPVPSQTQPPGIGSDKEIEAALPAEEKRPTLMDQAMRRMMADTLKMAGVIAEIRPGKCDEGIVEKGEGASHRCTMTYDGVEVAWKIQFSNVDASGGLTTANYRSWPVKGVLTAENVYAAYGWVHSEKDLRPRCDRMPKIFGVEAGKASGYECQVLLYECIDGKERFRWSNAPVWISKEGRVEFGEPEAF